MPQFFGLYCLRFGQIVLFVDVLVEIKQLNGVVLVIFQQLVVTVADGSSGALHAVVAVMWEVPIDGVAFQRMALQRGNEAEAVNGLTRQRRQTRHIEKRGIKVVADNGLTTDNTCVRLSGPFDDAGDADAAFVEPALGTTQRKVRRGVNGVELVGAGKAVGIADIHSCHATIV